MKKNLDEMEDDLRPEYDFSKLKVVARGPARTSIGGLTVMLEPEVAKKFPNSKSVNRALKLIIDVAEQTAKVEPAT